MQWLNGQKPQRCPLTGMTLDMRRRYVAILQRALQRAVIDQKGLDAIRALVPELGPNGVEPDFDE